MKHIKKFEQYKHNTHNENYEYEDFTYNDMEMVKELYEDGMTDAKDISREMDMSEETIKQILSSLKKSKQISESCGTCTCETCGCNGNCNCECCNCLDCGEVCCNCRCDRKEPELLYCKSCGEYIGGIVPTNLCLGCSKK